MQLLMAANATPELTHCIVIAHTEDAAGSSALAGVAYKPQHERAAARERMTRRMVASRLAELRY